MPISQDKLEKIIASNFPEAKITITDLAGDQNHYRLEIADKIFADKSRIQQHKIVNQILKEELKGPLHALQIKTKAL